jgi:hypothetical protein
MVTDTVIRDLFKILPTTAHDVAVMGRRTELASELFSKLMESHTLISKCANGYIIDCIK